MQLTDMSHHQIQLVAASAKRTIAEALKRVSARPGHWIVRFEF